MTYTYYRGAHGIFIVYDLTDRKSFESLGTWIERVSQNSDQNTFKILVGNKRDLHLQRVVSYDEASSIANQAGMLYFECSAKEYSSIQELILMMIDNIYQSHASNNVATQADSKNISLKKVNHKEQGGCFN